MITRRRRRTRRLRRKEKEEGTTKIRRRHFWPGRKDAQGGGIQKVIHSKVTFYAEILFICRALKEKAKMEMQLVSNYVHLNKGVVSKMNSCLKGRGGVPRLRGRRSGRRRPSQVPPLLPPPPPGSLWTLRRGRPGRGRRPLQAGQAHLERLGI